MFVVRGQCHDMEGAPPYLPFVEAIEYGLTVAARDVFRAAMGEAGPEIARFVPKVRVAFPELPPPLALPTDQARHYMFESVCDFFAARGGDPAAADRAGGPALGRRVHDADCSKAWRGAPTGRRCW